MLTAQIGLCYNFCRKGGDNLTFWENVLQFLDAEMEQPGLYGWFHLLSIAVTVIATLALCRYYKKSVRHVVLSVAVTVAVLEVYKQINFGFSYGDGISFDYAWYAFPFQFCSTPMYVGLLAGLTKRGKVHNAACAYLATYAVFAGLCVMAYPSTVFVDTIGINIQTMFCHGSMISVGIYLFYSGYVKLEHKTILRAIPVFLTCVLLAAVMNEAAYQTGLLKTDTFDMFFISPYCEPSLPVYSMVQKAVPFPWCLFIYVLSFTLAAYLVLLAAMGVKAFTSRRQIKTAV